uniref:Uncharacterized protein n=1 Tax=Spongospora subterranea TaxID=70186 RepID=A0A0H5QFG3_9EUKA|eukprot:CRZ00695.1 hypothetical protein [Spongospora subterranea]
MEDDILGPTSTIREQLEDDVLVVEIATDRPSYSEAGSNAVDYPPSSTDQLQSEPGALLRGNAKPKAKLFFTVSQVGPGHTYSYEQNAIALIRLMRISLLIPNENASFWHFQLRRLFSLILIVIALSTLIEMTLFSVPNHAVSSIYLFMAIHCSSVYVAFMTSGRHHNLVESVFTNSVQSQHQQLILEGFLNLAIRLGKVFFSIYTISIVLLLWTPIPLVHDVIIDATMGFQYLTLRAVLTMVWILASPAIIFPPIILLSFNKVCQSRYSILHTQISIQDTACDYYNTIAVIGESINAAIVKTNKTVCALTLSIFCPTCCCVLVLAQQVQFGEYSMKMRVGLSLVAALLLVYIGLIAISIARVNAFDAQTQVLASRLQVGNRPDHKIDLLLLQQRLHRSGEQIRIGNSFAITWTLIGHVISVSISAYVLLWEITKKQV